MLLNDYWPHYMTTCARLRECTITGYESAWRLHCGPLAGLDMDGLNSENIQAWLDGFVHPGAARKAWGVVRAMLRRARREGVTTTDVSALLLDLPVVPHYEAETYSAEQLRVVLRGCWGWDLEAWFITTVSLGLRPEESYAADWKDLNLRSGVVKITKGLQWSHGREILVEPKTELSRRKLVLPAYARQRLRQIKGKGRLIGTLTPPQVARRWKTYCQQQGLPYVPPESLRHTWATLALKAHIDISVVSRCLGHASIETTANHYLHPDIGIIRDEQKKFDAMITA